MKHLIKPLTTPSLHNLLQNLMGDWGPENHQTYHYHYYYYCYYYYYYCYYYRGVARKAFF